jgi:hypothetical protein
MQEQMNRVEIPLSKKKLWISIAGCIGFVAIGIYILTSLADEQSRVSPLIAKAVGIASIVLFGALGIFAVLKLSDKKPGLIVDDAGITDNASAVAAGLILWKDITGIRTKQISTTKFLLIDTINPERYMEGVSSVKKGIMRMNMKMYGTPVTIAASALQYNFNDLEQIIRQRFEQSR